LERGFLKKGGRPIQGAGRLLRIRILAGSGDPDRKLPSSLLILHVTEDEITHINANKLFALRKECRKVFAANEPKKRSHKLFGSELQTNPFGLR
jgi:hypothetical protein